VADDLVSVNVALPRDRLADLYGLLAQWVAGDPPVAGVAGGQAATPAGGRPTPTQTSGERFKH
jgi:hypothetical protein